MQISVVMATYNGERFIEPQLRSLFAQSCPPIELIVGDDGSQDTTLAILERLAAESPFPIRIIRNPARLGYADNFLSACDQATGELIALCDQDDIWLPHKLAKAVADFERHPDAAMVIHRSLVVDEVLNSTSAHHPNIPVDRHAPTGQSRLLDRPPGFSMVFRRAMLDGLDRRERPEDLEFAEGPSKHDTWFYALANAQGGIVYDSEVLAHYRRHGGNSSYFRPGSAVKRRVGQMLANLTPVPIERLRKLNRAYADHQRVFERLAEANVGARGDGFRHVAGLYARQAEVTRARLDLRAASPLPRALRILRLLGSGGYGPLRGLDRRSLAQDLGSLLPRHASIAGQGS